MISTLFKRLPLALATALLMAGCSTPEDTQRPARDITPIASPKEAAPSQPAQPVRTADWTTWPRESGEWVYRRDDRGSIALFGEPDRDAKFTIRCDIGERLIVLSRAGTATGEGQMLLRASQGQTSIDSRPVQGGVGYVAAGLSPRAPILDQLAYSRGHFAVEIAGIKPIKVPAWPELAHVIEDCRA